LEAVEDAFGADIDYAQLQKINGAPTDAEVRRFSLQLSYTFNNLQVAVADNVLKTRQACGLRHLCDFHVRALERRVFVKSL